MKLKCWVCKECSTVSPCIRIMPNDETGLISSCKAKWVVSWVDFDYEINVNITPIKEKRGE